LWRRPRPKLGCGAKERKEEKGHSPKPEGKCKYRRNTFYAVKNE
jgi:hypothetical protein